MGICLGKKKQSNKTKADGNKSAFNKSKSCQKNILGRGEHEFEGNLRKAPIIDANQIKQKGRINFKSPKKKIRRNSEEMPTCIKRPSSPSKLPLLETLPSSPNLKMNLRNKNISKFRSKRNDSALMETKSTIPPLHQDQAESLKDLDQSPLTIQVRSKEFKISILEAAQQKEREDQDCFSLKLSSIKSLESAPDEFNISFEQEPKKIGLEESENQEDKDLEESYVSSALISGHKILKTEEFEEDMSYGESFFYKANHLSNDSVLTSDFGKSSSILDGTDEEDKLSSCGSNIIEEIIKSKIFTSEHQSDVLQSARATESKNKSKKTKNQFLTERI